MKYFFYVAYLKLLLIKNLITFSSNNHYEGLNLIKINNHNSREYISNRHIQYMSK